MNMAPIPGGDEPIRRLDTQVVNLVKDTLEKVDQENYKAMTEVIIKLLGYTEGGEKHEVQNQLTRRNDTE